MNAVFPDGQVVMVVEDELLIAATLEADLLRHQQSGDFAMQAETLLRLAQLAEEDNADSLAQGLYGQAWTAAQQSGHIDDSIQAMRGIGRVMTGAVGW